MAVQFLTDDWAQAVTDALNNHPGFRAAMGTADLSIQFNTAEAPSGDVSYYMNTSAGTATVALGSAESPDVTINQSYDTASSISKGELHIQTAFMTGKIKVAGNLAKLMMHQKAIGEWGSAVKTIEVDY